MESSNNTKPDPWNLIHNLAATQQGLFSTTQAQEAGFSSALLRHHIQSGNLVSPQRGIYRLANYPSGDQEEFIQIWLWSKQQATFSHATSLTLHGLSDALPTMIHITLPLELKNNRRKTPDGIRAHYAEISENECTWIGDIQTTTIKRTLADCVATGLSPELLGQAIQEATSRGLIDQADLIEVLQAVSMRGSARDA